VIYVNIFKKTGLAGMTNEEVQKQNRFSRVIKHFMTKLTWKDKKEGK